MNRADLRRRWYRALEPVPIAYCAWQRRFPGRHVVDRRTDLVVEGYPSAANTFAREALEHANRGIRIASHLHTVAHVRRALHLGVPVVILLRPPVDSVVSVLARFPGQSSGVASELRDYVRFYRGVLALSGRVALACFEDTTTRLGGVTGAVNRQLGTSFAPFDDNDPEAQRAVQARIDSWTEVVFGPGSEHHRAFPSVQRRAAASALRNEVRGPAHAALRAQAEALNSDLAAIARERFDRMRSDDERAVAESAG
ncbi:MAG: hypothetical protein ACRDY4_07335 [Acidimicrobiia bacterium]